MLSSWFCRPKLPATSTTIWRQVQGIVGRKSVTTNCRHWKAVRINDSLKRNRTLGMGSETSFANIRRAAAFHTYRKTKKSKSLSVPLFPSQYSYPWSLRIAPMTPKTRGQPGPRLSPWLCRICRTLSNCFCRMSAWRTLDSSFKGLSSRSCSRLERRKEG